MNTKNTALILLTALTAAVLLCTPALAVSITDTTLTNVNVYAGSNQYDIAPSDYYDDTTTATDITRVSGRYIYAIGLTANPNPVAANQRIIFSVTGQQGAAILQGTNRAESGYTYTYGDGTSGITNLHAYALGGVYNTQVTLANPGKTSGISVNGDAVTVIAGPQIQSVKLTSSTPALTYQFISATVSASSLGGTELRYQWYYSTNGSTSWIEISGATSADVSFLPESIGTYTLKVIVTDDSGFTDSYEAGFTDVTAQIVTTMASDAISFSLWIVLIVIAALLLAYAILVESPIPYSEIVALVISTIITWTVTILYASGNVVTEEVSVVKQSVVDNLTTLEYDLLQYPVIDGTVTALLIVFAIGLSLYCMYILIPTVVDLVNGGND